MLVYIRGLLRVTTAVTGLLLVYGIVFAMEGISTRIPMITVRELLITALFALPWTLLLLAGFDDFSKATGTQFVFWVGVALAVTLLYYLNWHTTVSSVTKMTMPLAATTPATLPYLFRGLRFVFTACSILAGLAGIGVLYFAFGALYLGSFATTGIALLVSTFGLAATAVGAWAAVSMVRGFTHSARA